MPSADLAASFLTFVEADPGAEALVTAADGAGDVRLSRSDLLRLSLAYVGGLRGSGIGPGDRVVLALRTGVEFVSLFWALQLLGAAGVPVPALEPGAAFRERRDRLRNVCAVAEPALLIVAEDALTDVADLTCCRASTPGRLRLGGPVEPLPTIGGDTIGVIQFTSGSTAAPRGCVLTQRALLTNARAANERCGAHALDTAVSWLPLFHDMGLMAGVIAPVVAHARSCLRQTSRFMFNPLSWLRDLAAFGATHTAVPNFALAMVMLRLARNPLTGVDLSGVRSIICGAEPVEAGLARDFMQALAPAGLRPDVFQAAYGMAEATLMITSKPGGLSEMLVDRRTLQSDRRAEPGSRDDSISIVSLGMPVPGVAIRIRDENGRAVRDGRVGSVEVLSPAAMNGYYADSDATAAAFDEGWLISGDLGFLHDGELFLIGRARDSIIVAGRNIAPFDIEAAVGRSLRIPSSAVAAFGALGALGTEEIHVVVEYRAEGDPASLSQAVRAACIDGCGVTAHNIYRVRPGFIPRTTSGKVRRRALRERWLSEGPAFAAPWRADPI